MANFTPEQKMAIESIAGSYAVRAGAGSGKTRVLVERFLYILKQKKAQADAILAITFTRKAAKEMRERIAKLLEERMREATGEERLYFAEQIALLPRAQISTIDSLCSLIVRENPVEAGLAPNFAVCEEYEAVRFYRQEAERYLLAALRRHESIVSELVAYYGYKRLRTLLIEAAAKLSYVEGEDFVKLYLEAADDAATKDTMEPEEAAALAQKLIPILTDFAQVSHAHALKAGLITFTEIMEQAIKILQANPEIASYYRLRYPYIMVDEYQDTSPRQAQLIHLLSSGKLDSLEGANLFVVGDDKQSIYRFRGAEVRVFADIIAEIERLGHPVIVMADNFRSQPEILTCCNQIFAPLMQASEAESRVSFQALNARRDSSNHKVKLTTVLGAKGVAPELSRRKEAALIAEEIVRLVSSEGVKYSEIGILLSAIKLAQPLIEALSARHIPYQLTDGKGFYERQEIIDIMNLLRFLAAPWRDIELLGFLRSYYGGISDEAITCLVGMKGEGTLWQALAQKSAFPTLSKEQNDLLQQAAEHLARLISVASSAALPELFASIYAELQLEVMLSCEERGEELLANVAKLRELAVTLSMEQGYSLSQFVEHIRFLREEDLREGAASASAGLDAVEIMTIHKAKGLEFPVVFLPALDRKGASGGAGLLYTPEDGLGIRGMDSANNWLNTALYQKIQEADAKFLSYEQIRLLYVGMTRAEDRLYLSGVLPAPNKDGSYRQSHLTNVRKYLATCQEAQCVEYDSEVEVPVTVVEKQAESTLPEDLDATSREVVLAQPRLSFSASSLAEYELCPRRYYYHYVALLPAMDIVTWGKGVSPKLLGLVIHSALELGGEEALEQALTLQNIPSYERSAIREEALKLIMRYEASPLYKQVVPYAADAEQEFCAVFPLPGGGSVEFRGFIDKVVHYPGGELGIIDYKTGRPPEKGEEKTAYLRQLLIYALALEKITGQRVRDAQLHFLRDLTAVSLVGERKKLTQELFALCEKIGVLREEADFLPQMSACKSCPYAYCCKRDKE